MEEINKKILEIQDASKKNEDLVKQLKEEARLLEQKRKNDEHILQEQLRKENWNKKRDKYNLYSIMCHKHYKDSKLFNEDDLSTFDEQISKTVINVLFPKKSIYNIEDVIIYRDRNSGEEYKYSYDLSTYEKYKFSNSKIIADNASIYDPEVNYDVSYLILDELDNMNSNW